MDIAVNKGRNTSLAEHANLLANRDKIYLFDNHLCAYWCWSQLDLSKRFDLLHVDRHYDLCKYDPLDAELLTADPKVVSINDLVKIRKKTTLGEFQILRWDKNAT